MDPALLEEEPELEASASDTDEDQDSQDEASQWDDPLADDEDLQKAFLDLYLKCSAEDRYARLIEVKDVKQAENYWAGRQYWYWSDRDETWKPASGVGVSAMGDLDLDEMPRFEFVTNIYQATGLTEIGAVAGAPPRIRFFPDDADNSDDLETAEGRTKLSRLIQRWNPPQMRLQEEMYHAWTGGFICLRTRYVENGEKFGFDERQVLSEEEVPVDSTIHCSSCGWSAPAMEAMPPVPCPGCGKMLTDEDISEEDSVPVPGDGGSEDVPRGRQVIEVYGALNCKRPQHTNAQAQWHYFAIEDEVHYSILKANAPTEEIDDKIKPGMNFGPDDAFERNARLAVAENAKTNNATGSKQSSLVTYANVWFRPSAYSMMDKSQRARAKEIFPRGAYIEFAGDTFYRSKHESMDDTVVCRHAMPGRGQHRPSVGGSMISVQDRFNTFSNIEAETYEYGIPITYRAADTFASDADDEQRAAPGLEVEVALQPGTDIRQRILQVRADSVSPDMAKHTMDLMGPVTQYLSGAFPALSGAADDAPETLGQQAMQRDQAMGRMGVFYVNLKQAEADILTLACKDFEQHAQGEVRIPVLADSGDFESESVDVSALDGDAEAYPEGDENFPELWNQQRATLMQIADSAQGVELLADMGNRQLFAKLTGIPDLKVPGMDAWQKQLKEISELTKIPEGDDLLAGLAPSVEVDSDDFHDVESACCKWWMNNERGQKAKRENPMGWLAVKAHKALHDKAIPKPVPEQKPLSETFSTAFKDLPPAAKIQALAQVGINITPDDLLDQAFLEKLSKPAPKPIQPPTGAGETRPNV
jgi:hypothetical protein